VPHGRSLADHEGNATPTLSGWRGGVTVEHGDSLGNRGVISPGDGDWVTVSAEETPVRFLLASGKPIGERVAWYGPIVMNTREELRVAFEEYSAGTFIKHH